MINVEIYKRDEEALFQKRVLVLDRNVHTSVGKQITPSFIYNFTNK